MSAYYYSDVVLKFVTICCHTRRNNLRQKLFKINTSKVCNFDKSANTEKEQTEQFQNLLL